MLTRAANSSRQVSQTQGNCLAAGTEHSPGAGEILDQNKGSTDGTVLDQPRKKSKGKRKASVRRKR